MSVGEGKALGYRDGESYRHQAKSCCGVGTAMASVQLVLVR